MPTCRRTRPAGEGRAGGGALVRPHLGRPPGRDADLQRTPAELLFRQVLMAAVLALVASAVVLLAPLRSEVLSARIAVAVFIGVLVTSGARASGRTAWRAVAVGMVALGVAPALATVKVALT